VWGLVTGLVWAVPEGKSVGGWGMWPRGFRLRSGDRKVGSGCRGGSVRGVSMALLVRHGAVCLRRPAGAGAAPDGAPWRRLSAGLQAPRPVAGSAWSALGCAVKGQAQVTAPWHAWQMLRSSPSPG
jgi:hypothetical protein